MVLFLFLVIFILKYFYFQDIHRRGNFLTILVFTISPNPFCCFCLPLTAPDTYRYPKPYGFDRLLFILFLFLRCNLGVAVICKRNYIVIQIDCERDGFLFPGIIKMYLIGKKSLISKEEKTDKPITVRKNT